MTRALGRYELLRPLGRGGMAEVFLARRRAAGIEKLLVVKRIRPERANDVEFLDLFVREARLSMSLTHQNIVPVFDFGRIDDQVYFAMERIEGKDLGSSLARAGDNRRMPAVVAAFIAAECCQALDYAHHKRRDGEKLGIVHRDVTPRNVLISWAGEVKLTDFGIAALAGDETSKLLGTPAYMAPEQARREAIDVRTDVYSVGLMLREAITGKRARGGADREALIAQARAGTLEAWPEDLEIARELASIVDRATAPNPNDRYPDARSMFAELDAYIVGERAAQRGDSPARRLAMWLGEVWEGARDDTGSHMALDANVISLFEEAVGTGTERSLLATATDGPSSAPKPAPKPSPAPTPAPEPAQVAPESTAHVPKQAAAPPGRWLPAIIVAAVAVAIALFIGLREGDVPRPDQPTTARVEPPPTPPPPRPAPAQPPPRPVEVVQPAGSGSAPPPPTPPTAGSGSARKIPSEPAKPPVVVRTVRPPQPPQPPPPVAATPRDVPINSTPWSNFTVDSDPTVYQTLAHVMLTPGTHTIRFKNPTLHIEYTETILVPSSTDEPFAVSVKLPSPQE